MSNKNILIIGNYPPPYGGVPRHIQYLVPSLVENGYKVHILSGGDTGVNKENGITVYKYNKWKRRKSLLNGFRKNLSIWHKYFPQMALNFPKQLYWFISSISLGREIVRAKNISLIKAYNFFSSAPIGAILSKEYSIPLVISNFGEFFTQEKFFSQNSSLINFMINQASRRLCMTKHCAGIYKNLGVNSSYEIVKYGIDLNVFYPDNSDKTIRTNLGIGNDEFTVLYLARMCEEMGLEIFIKAAKYLLKENSSLKFIIGGKPETSYQSALAFKKAFPLNVFVIPDIPYSQLPNYYRAADVIAVPTLGDRACGSLSAAEAGACEKPVIASKIGGIPEFIADGQTGVLIPPGSPQDLASELMKLSKNPKLTYQMGQAGRSFVEKNFNMDATNKRFLEIFDEENKNI